MIQAYASTEKANEDEIRQFHEELNQIQYQIKIDDRVLVIGDSNAKIEKRKTDNNQILGRFSFGERN